MLLELSGKSVNLFHKKKKKKKGGWGKHQNWN